MKKEIVDNDELLNIVNEIEKLFGNDDNNRTTESLKKNFPNEIEKLEEVSLTYFGENYLKF